MKLDNNFKITAVVTTILVMQLASAESYAQADSSATEKIELEEIIVVGSRRADRSVQDSNVPVDFLDISKLEKTGSTETNQLLANLLPSFNFPQPSITDGTDHVRPAQMRGLAPDHTLVLINGKRRHASALINLNGSTGRGSSAVDLNSVPANAIKNIQVLRDGAAAQYGSDAIAGVINVVLKDASEGGSISVVYGGNNTTFDGVPQLESVTTDVDGNLAFTTGGARSANDGETITLRANKGFEVGDGGFLNVSFEHRDRELTNRSDYESREVYDRIDGQLDPREFTYDRYNTRFGNSGVKDLNVFYNLGVPIGESEFYSFGSYNKREGESAGFNRLAGNSRNVLEIYPDGFLPLITSDIDDYSFAFGYRGVVREWNYDASVVYGKDEFNFGVTNSLNTSLGADSQTTFDAGTLVNTQVVLNLDFSKLSDISGFTNPVNIALGFEYRDESYEINAGETASYIDGGLGGPAGSQVFAGFAPSSEVDIDRDSFSAYFELDTDLSDNWNLNLAIRAEDYSDFGSTVNGKLATRFAINDNFALRGSVSTGFRAPSLAQQSFTSVATVFVDGIPTETGTFRPSSDVALALGSPGLDSESSESFGAGFTWNPTDQLGISVDYYNIKIDDRIVLSSNLGGDGVETLLAGTGANRARFFLNGIDSKTQGVDIVATYGMDLDKNGHVNFSLGYNYSDNEVIDVIDPPAQLAAVA